MFRKLLNPEVDELRRIKERKGIFINPNLSKADYLISGNFTVCLLKTGSVLRVGVTKRNPSDSDSFLRAARIALWRAAQCQPIKE